MCKVVLKSLVTLTIPCMYQSSELSLCTCMYTELTKCACLSHNVIANDTSDTVDACVLGANCIGAVDDGSASGICTPFLKIAASSVQV